MINIQHSTFNGLSLIGKMVIFGVYYLLLFGF